MDAIKSQSLPQNRHFGKRRCQSKDVFVRFDDDGLRDWQDPAQNFRSYGHAAGAELAFTPAENSRTLRGIDAKSRYFVEDFGQFVAIVKDFGNAVANDSDFRIALHLLHHA